MRQFDVLPNGDAETGAWAPYLLVLQHDLLRDLATVIVAPLVCREHFARPADVLNPIFRIEDTPVVLSVAELAGVSRHQLGEPVGSLAGERGTVMAAVDMLFTGI